MVARIAVELGATGGVQAPPASISAGSPRLASSRRLRGRRDVERAAQLRHRGADVRRADGVADTGAGEAVDLRERAQHDHPAPVEDVLVDRIGVVGPVDVLEVGLVDHGQDVRGTRSMNASSSALVFIVPVGLFGWQT